MVRLGLPFDQIFWNMQFSVGSIPDVAQFNISWRDDAHHVIILFTDEEPQTYARPPVTQRDLIEVLNEAEDLKVYTFSEPNHRNMNFSDSWEPVAINGQWFELTANSAEMFERLIEILDETACGGNDDPNWAYYNASPRQITKNES